VVWPVERHPAVDSQQPQVEHGGQGEEFVVDLVGQLPGRDQHQAARLPRQPLAARGSKPDQQRQPEG
jgi:hypothetical protein